MLIEKNNQKEEWGKNPMDATKLQTADMEYCGSVTSRVVEKFAQKSDDSHHQQMEVTDFKNPYQNLSTLFLPHLDICDHGRQTS